MRIERGFTPITLDLDKQDLQLLVDAINFSPIEVPLRGLLFNASVITSQNGTICVNGSKGSGLIERPTALTLNIGNQVDFDTVLDSFKMLAGALGPTKNTRRIVDESKHVPDQRMVKQHRMLTEAVNKLCQINPPPSSLHSQG